MKEKQRKFIPVRRMDTHILPGIDFRHGTIAVNDEITEAYAEIIHRDEYYIFLFFERAKGFINIDFEEIEITKNSVLYIRPGQIHYVNSKSKLKAEAWFLAIDSALVEKDYKNVFEGQFLTQRPIVSNTCFSSRMNETANLLLNTLQAQSTPFSNGIITNIANVFIGNIAGQYAAQPENLKYNKSRSAQIAHQFKEVLSKNYIAIKSPTEYAKILNYSLSHLNESVKGITGFPVSYWIHQQIVLEAKRLLYYTDMDVKEIAFSLGYEDHTYFSRLFSKVVGVSPGVFRHKFHE